MATSKSELPDSSLLTSIVQYRVSQSVQLTTQPPLSLAEVQRTMLKSLEISKRSGVSEKLEHLFVFFERYPSYKNFLWGPRLWAWILSGPLSAQLDWLASQTDTTTLPLPTLESSLIFLEEVTVCRRCCGSIGPDWFLSEHATEWQATCSHSQTTRSPTWADENRAMCNFIHRKQLTPDRKGKTV